MSSVLSLLKFQVRNCMTVEEFRIGSQNLCKYVRQNFGVLKIVVKFVEEIQFIMEEAV